MLLMPAVMHVLGGSAWWLPRWLDRLLPNITIEPPHDGEREHAFEVDRPAPAGQH